MYKAFPVLIATVIAGCGGPAGTPTPAPAPERVLLAPGAATYRIAAHSHVEQEVQGQTMSLDPVSIFYLGAELTRVPEGFRATISIDSVEVFEGADFPLSVAKSAQGAVFSAVLSSTGVLTDLTGGDSTNQFLQQLEPELRLFFPRLPAGGGAPGLTWTDTTEVMSRGSGAEIMIVLSSDHEAVGWSQYEGARTLEIRTATTFTLSGEGSQGGVDFTIEGSGTSMAHTYLSPSGMFLGRTSSDSASAIAMVTAMGMIVPIEQRGVDTVTVIR